MNIERNSRARGVGMYLAIGLVLVACSRGPGEAEGRLSKNAGKILQILTDSSITEDKLAFGESKKYIFGIRNNLDRVIHLDRIQASCTCTDAQIEDEILGPGQTTNVVLDIRLDTRFGKTVRAVVGGSGLPTEDYIHLSVRVEADYSQSTRFVPETVNLGTLSWADASGSGVLSLSEVRAVLPDDIERGLRVDVDEPWLQANATGWRVVPGRDALTFEHVWVVEWRAGEADPASLGSLSALVEAHVLDHPKLVPMPTVVTAKFVSAVETYPGRVYFGVGLTETAEADVRLSIIRRGARNVRLVPDTPAVRVTVLPDGAYRLQVNCESLVEGEEFSGEIAILTDVGDTQTSDFLPYWGSLK